MNPVDRIVPHPRITGMSAVPSLHTAAGGIDRIATEADIAARRDRST